MAYQYEKYTKSNIIPTGLRILGLLIFHECCYNIKGALSILKRASINIIKSIKLCIVNLIVDAHIPPVLVLIVLRSGSCSGLERTFPYNRIILDVYNYKSKGQNVEASPICCQSTKSREV